MKRTNRIIGKKIADKILKKIKLEVSKGQKKFGSPQLLSISVGENPAATIYNRSINYVCNQIGIDFFQMKLLKTVSQKKIISILKEVSKNSKIDGIIIQFPLPKQIDANVVSKYIDPYKDVDCIHPDNLGKLLKKAPTFYPCASHGVMLLLGSIKQKLKGKHAVVIGASNIGKSMAIELIQADCTVTVCNLFTQNLQGHVNKADILISAVGHPELIKARWIKPGATVIDIGITCLNNKKIIGDIEDNHQIKAAHMASTPGGVGPMTVAMLLQNTLTAWKLKGDDRV